MTWGLSWAYGMTVPLVAESHEIVASLFPRS